MSDWLDSPEELGEAMQLVPLAEAFAKAVKAAVRAKLEEGAKVEGYKLKSGGYSTTYDAVETAKILMDSGLLELEDIHSAMKINIKGLGQTWADKAGMTKTEADRDLKKRLSDIASRKPRQKSVVKDRG